MYTKCVLGRDRLLFWWSNARSKLSQDMCGLDFNIRCNKPRVCLLERLGVLNGLKVLDDQDRLLMTPLRILELPTDCLLCPNCNRLLCEKYDSLRSEGWAKLPSFFGLPEWEDLKNGI